MSNKVGYEKQQNLSLAQFLAEVPSFFAVLVSAILTHTILVFVDLFDSFIYLIRIGLVVLLSKKLTKNLKYEYNYGVGKIEAIASLLCDGMAAFGLLITLGISVYSIFHPEAPSDLVIAVVGLKAINVSFDIAFFIKQRNILKIHNSAISDANYAEALAALLLDSVTLVSLLTMWLLRDNPIGGYISPVVSIFVVIYLLVGCNERIRQALVELTDKTLPEEQQMKILTVMTRHYDSYTQVHSINSHKSGDAVLIDLHLSFEKGTTFEEIAELQKQLQDEFVQQIGPCEVNIVVGSN